MKIENANSAIAIVTGLQVGTYVITLTVKDERNLESHDSVRVIVREGMYFFSDLEMTTLGLYPSD